jgi:hypothetical protein
MRSGLHNFLVYLGFLSGRHTPHTAGYVASAIVAVGYTAICARLLSVRETFIRPSLLKLLALALAVVAGILEFSAAVLSPQDVGNRCILSQRHHYPPVRSTCSLCGGFQLDMYRRHPSAAIEYCGNLYAKLVRLNGMPNPGFNLPGVAPEGLTIPVDHYLRGVDAVR